MTADEGTASGPGQGARPRRRQARGERRLEQLLEAAATVFARSGYTAASTNAIAREAGVSPGTLYQFFPNKEAIAIEMGQRFLHKVRQAQGQYLTTERAGLPFDEFLDTTLDPLIELNCQHPAFLALINSSETPGRLAEEEQALHASLISRLVELIAVRAPTLPETQRTHTAHMTFALFKAGMELVLRHTGEDRDAYVGELKAAIHRYLAPVIDPNSTGNTP